MSDSSVSTTGPTGDTPSAADIVDRMERQPYLPYHRRIATIIGWTYLLDAFDVIAIAVALTVILTVFDTGLLGASVIVSAAYVGQFVGSVLIGRYGDRSGRRRSLLVAVLWMGIASLLVAAAWNIESLILLRLVQGIGLGAAIPAAATMLNETLSGRIRGRITMTFQLLFVVGLVITPLFGIVLFAVVGPEVGWRLMFVLGAAPIVLAVIARRVLPESPRWLADRGRLDEANQIVEHIEQERVRLGRPAIEPPPAAATPAPVSAGAAAGGFRELFAPAYRRRSALVLIMTFTAMFTQYGYTTLVPSLYVKVAGLTPTNALWLSAATGGVSLVYGYLFARTVDRFGRKPWFVLTFAFGVVGALFGVFAPGLGATNWIVLFVAGVLLMIGTIPIAMGWALYVPELFPTRIRATATGTVSAGIRVASALVAPLAGLLIGTRFGLAAMFAMFGVLMVIGLVVMAVLGIETKQRRLEDTSR